MLISVIIPTYNSEKYIAETLESAINQTYKNIEIIVVDDSSLDKTTKIVKNFIKKDSRIKLFRSLKNTVSGTPSYPRNIGIKKANGKYLSFLDSDDLWAKEKLKTQIKHLKKKDIISFTDCKYLNDGKFKNESFVNKKFINIALSNLPEGLLLYNPIRLSSVLIKKTVLVEKNFNEDSEISGVEDLEMWLNFSKKNYFKNISYVKERLVFIRRHQNNLTNKYNLGVIKNIYCITKFMINDTKSINFKFFLAGVFFRSLMLIKYYYFEKIKFFLKLTVALIILLFLVFFKSPFPDYIGSKLIHTQEIDKSIKNLVIFSSGGYGKPYLKRFKDAQEIIKANNIENVYIMGNDDIIPEHRVISSLLIYNNFPKSKIKLTTTNLNTTRDDILYMGNILKKDKIESVIFITEKYRSLRSMLIWKKNYPKINIQTYHHNEKVLKDSKWMRNKKIFYEYCALAYNYLRNWI